MMRFNGPITTGFSLEAKPTNVIPEFLESVSAAELIAPTAIIISTFERIALATNSQPILPDRPIIFGIISVLSDAPMALSKALCYLYLL